MAAWRQLPVLVLMVLVIYGCGLAPSSVDSLRPILEPRDLPVQAWQDHASADVDEATRQLLSAPLGVEDALRVALLNNRTLRANLRTFDARRARAMEEIVLANPEASAHVLFGADDFKAEGELKFPLTPLLQRSIRSDLVRADTESGRIEAALFVLDFTFEIQSAYYEHVANGARLRLEREALHIAEAASTTAELLYEAGNVTGLELVTNQAFASEARRQVLAAEAVHASSRKRLHRLMGLESRGDELSWEVLESLPLPPHASLDQDELARAASENSLSMALEGQRLSFTQGRLRLERQVRWLPHLSIGVATQYEDDEWKIGPALSLGLPILDRRRHAVDAMGAEELAIKARMEAEARRIDTLAEEIHERLELAHQAVRHFDDELLPLRRRVVEEALLQYNAMELSVFDLLRVRQDEIHDQRARQDALLEFWLTHARREHLRAGGTLD